MEFQFLRDRINSLSEEDYERIGFAGNPAYHGLRCGDVEEMDVHIPREPLESELKSLLDTFSEGGDFKHAYLYSQGLGAGKSQEQNVLKDYCLTKGLPFVELNHDESDAIGMVRYMIDLSHADRIVVFCGCQTRFYDRLVELKQVCVVGGGHSPGELKGIEDKFRIFDLEKDYPLSSDDIYALLKKTLEALALKPVVSIPDSFLKSLSREMKLPGMALDALGTCLAVLAYKAATGQEPKMSQDDLRYCCDKQFIRWLSGFRRLPMPPCG